VAHRAFRWPIAIVLVMLSTTGCATQLIPPDRASLKEPVDVYLLDLGRTPSLVVPDPQGGGMTRYAYGNWNWYALQHRGVLDGLAALFLPTRGALGRQELPGVTTAADVRRQGPGTENFYTLTVEREAVLRLRAEMDEIFKQNRHTRVVNTLDKLEFVHHPRRYCAFSNSNHAVAGWLRQLGVRTKGPAIFSVWAVQE
jgi:hypothetical protein